MSLKDGFIYFYQIAKRSKFIKFFAPGEFIKTSYSITRD